MVQSLRCTCQVWPASPERPSDTVANENQEKSSSVVTEIWVWSIGVKDRLSWRSRVQMRWSYFVVRGSRLAKAIAILFTEYFYRYSSYTLRDHPQISPSQPPPSADPAFSLRFPEVRVLSDLEAFRPSYPPSGVPGTWDGGCALRSYPYLLRAFPGCLVA